jgi:phage tail-like protein
MPTAGQRIDPFLNFNFRVEIDGITRAGFHEVTGLDSTVDVVEYREGGANTPMKLPGITKYGNITLKWGVTDDTQLQQWHQDVTNGTINRKNGSIVLLDASGVEQRRWNFRNGWPTKWAGSNFTGDGNAVWFESVDIAHEGLTPG